MSRVADQRVRWQRADDVAYVGGDERVVVLKLDPQGASPLALEGTGAAIWHALGPTPRPLDAIVAELASTYGVAASSIENEVSRFLMRLFETGVAVTSTSENT